MSRQASGSEVLVSARISLKEVRAAPPAREGGCVIDQRTLLALVEAVEAVHQWEIAVGDQDLALSEDRFRDALARFKDYEGDRPEAGKDETG